MRALSLARWLSAAPSLSLTHPLLSQRKYRTQTYTCSNEFILHLIISMRPFTRTRRITRLLSITTNTPSRRPPLGPTFPPLPPTLARTQWIVEAPLRTRLHTCRWRPDLARLDTRVDYFFDSICILVRVESVWGGWGIVGGGGSWVCIWVCVCNMYGDVSAVWQNSL